MQDCFSKLILFTLLSLAVSGCIATRYQSGAACSVRLSEADQILVPAVQSMPLASSADDLQGLKKKFAERNIAVKYLPEEEYTFAAMGIANPLALEHYDTLLARGYTYFLFIKVLDEKSGSDYEYYTPFELSQRTTPLNYTVHQIADETAHQVKLRFQLLSIRTRQTVYAVNVTTRINAWTKRDRDGGQQHVNLGNTGLATQVAMKKGAKRILKRCKE